MGKGPFPRVWKLLGSALALVALAAFVFLTEPPLLRRFDYVGAAVCHRIPSHSFFIDDHQLPLCQRCTGTFTGALTGLLFQWAILRRRRASRFPPLWVWGLMVFFLGLWGLDGFNSYSTLLTGTEEGILGYAPQPWIRLLTGTLVGMSMSIVLVPAFNQALWGDGVGEPPLRGWRDLAPLIGVELAQAALIYTLHPWLLYPISIYSSLGVLAMFVLLGAMVWVMAVGREGCCLSWRGAWLPLLWGLVFAGLIVGGMDGLRFYLTGSVDQLPAGVR
jgi:uncharacterized membrane protein